MHNGTNSTKILVFYVANSDLTAAQFPNRSAKEI